MKQIKCILLVILFLTTNSAWSQQQSSTTSPEKNLRRGVAAVMFATIGGAVLGLSTLSFYGKPQEHTGNITLGALAGLVAGISYVSYDASRKPVTSGTYDFSQTEMQSLKLKRTLVAENQSVPVVQYRFEF